MSLAHLFHHLKQHSIKEMQFHSDLIRNDECLTKTRNHTFHVLLTCACINIHICTLISIKEQWKCIISSSTGEGIWPGFIPHTFARRHTCTCISNTWLGVAGWSLVPSMSFRNNIATLLNVNSYCLKTMFLLLTTPDATTVKWMTQPLTED